MGASIWDFPSSLGTRRTESRTSAADPRLTLPVDTCIGASPQVTANVGRTIAVTPLADLLPSVRQALEEARSGEGWEAGRLNQAIRNHFGFLGAFTSARIESRKLEGQQGLEEVLVLEFSPPEGRDLAAAERRYEQASNRANRGEVRPALATYKKLAKEFPEVAKYHRALGQAHLTLGDLDDAEDSLLRSLALNPRDEDGLTLLGNLYTKRQRWLDAIPLYELSLKMRRNVYALTNLGAALAKTGRVQEAISCLREAVREDSSYPNAWYGLGLALSQLERIETLPEAIDALEKALSVIVERRRAPDIWDTSRGLLLGLSETQASEERTRAASVVAGVADTEGQRGGLPVRVEEHALSGALAKIELGWVHHRPYHRLLLTTEPSPHRQHHARHELEHLRLINSAREAGRNRWYASSAASREVALRSMEGDILRLSRKGIPEAQLTPYVATVLDGLLTQLFNFPIDFLIERRLLAEYPTWRELVFTSLRSQLETSVKLAFDPQVTELAPARIRKANTAMNGAMALWLDETFPHRTDFVFKFERADTWATSRKLYKAWKERADTWSPGVEYDWVDAWGDILNLREWYHWLPDDSTGS